MHALFAKSSSLSLRHRHVTVLFPAAQNACLTISPLGVRRDPTAFGMLEIIDRCTKYWHCETFCVATRTMSAPQSTQVADSSVQTSWYTQIELCNRVLILALNIGISATQIVSFLVTRADVTSRVANQTMILEGIYA